MRRVIFVGIILGYLFSAAAQEKVELFGYFEPTGMGVKLDNKIQQLYTNKLRVDLKSKVGENVTFAANFDYITYHGQTLWNILDFLAPGVTDAVPPAMRGLYTIPFSDRHFLDNAYLKIAQKYFDLTVGKQQISLGSGYVWNPVDVFNIKDPLDPTYEQPGHNAVRLDVPLGTRYTLSSLYSADNSWENSAKLIQFKGRLLHFDYSLVVAETVWRFHDYTQFDFSQMMFSEMPEKRQLLGLNTAGELFGLGIWAEYGYNKMESSKDYYELVAGTDYTFDFLTYIMVEFYRNTLGKTDHHLYDINDWMRMYASEQKAICRDQIYALLSHPVTDFIDVGTSCIFSLSDNSLALVPTLNYSFTENVDIMAYLNVNFGEKGTVYSEKSGNGGLLRARIYF
ncbi:hypothetical protein JW935_24685 [candidate division KSB1 bacterium]|nr:hypothetical protein [candidate division KSB1 bacterium]